MKEEILYLINKNLNFNDILIYLSLPKIELVSYYKKILNDDYIPLDLRMKLKGEYLENLFFVNLEIEKVIFISDTHIGSKDENIEYLNQVKYFIENNNINYLFHGGDIGDGMVNYHKYFNTYNKQIEHLLDIYFNKFEIKQYILGGNHDYKYKRKDVDILKLLSDNVLIENIGYYNAYFKIFDKVISFEHNSKKTNDLINIDFRILGHSHIGKFRENLVMLPASCDENSTNNLMFKPGFIVLESINENSLIKLLFTEYIYTENGPHDVNLKKYVLK